MDPDSCPILNLRSNYFLFYMYIINEYNAKDFPIILICVIFIIKGDRILQFRTKYFALIYYDGHVIRVVGRMKIYLPMMSLDGSAFNLR